MNDYVKRGKLFLINMLISFHFYVYEANLKTVLRVNMFFIYECKCAVYIYVSWDPYKSIRQHVQWEKEDNEKMKSYSFFYVSYFSLIAETSKLIHVSQTCKFYIDYSLKKDI